MRKHNLNVLFMKRILYILLSLLWMVSCNEEVMQSPVVSETGDKVTYTLSLSVPEAQQVIGRALGEWNMASAESVPLQLVVFDANQFFVEAVDAVYQSNNGEEVFFQATLSATEEKRIVHFILNSPKASSAYPFGMEHELIGQLTTDNQIPAYWQRLEFPNGTAVYGKDENGFVTVSASTEAQSRMTKIPMIRNFAKITVESKDDNFTLKEFTVINTWDRGTVAPYNQTGGTGAFTSFHTENNTGRTYAAITGEGYEGATPTDAVLMNAEAGSATFISPSVPFYMYERRNTYDNTNPTPTSFMLVKGTYAGEDYYYKIDLIYEKFNSSGQMQYYNVLRNFHYHVIINGVNGYGYETAEEAANRVANNNLSNSIDIRDFTNIAATVDNRLFVSYTDTTLVNTGMIQVKYRYLSARNTYDNDKVVIEELTHGDEKDCMASYEKAGTDGNWQVVNVTFDKLPTNEEVYTNILRFVAYHTLDDGTAVPRLAREVDFNLRKPMNMVVECNPRRVPEGVDEQVSANILIPVGITELHDPYQLFPLEFLIEAENLTLYPDVAKMESEITLSPSEMPVRTGISIVPDVIGNTFRYVRTITIEEYNALPTRTVTVEGVTGTYKVIPCYFKTNKAVSATKVYAWNKYFTLIKEGYFTNSDGIISHASLTESYYYSGKNVRVEFTASEEGVYTITSDNLNGSVTVTLLAGETYVSPEGAFTTATWADAGKVRVTFQDGDYVDIISADTRDVLQMWVKSATYNALDISASAMLDMYSTESEAKNQNGTTLTSVTVSQFLEKYTDVTIRNLQENDVFYFSFVDDGYVYVASSSAEALAYGTILAFNRFDLPPAVMSATFGSAYSNQYKGTRYYGEGKEVELTFTTDKAGKYSLSGNLTFVSVSGGNGEAVLTDGNTLTLTNDGIYTITCTTNTWNEVAQVTITEQGYDNSVLVNGAVRNLLFIQPKSMSGNNISNNTDIRMKVGSKVDDNSWNSAIKLGQRNTILNYGYTYEISGLSATSVFYLAYRSGTFRRTYYNSQQLTASDLANNNLEVIFTAN